MGLEVRRVESAAEFARLAEYRYRVYVEDLGLLDASAADRERRRLIDALDDASISYAVFDGDRVVGSLRFTHLPDVPDPEPLIRKFDYGDSISAFGASAICMTSRFIVDEPVRRSRAMLRMMEMCYEDGEERGVRLNYGDTSPGLLLFYEHMGYRRYTRPWNDPVFGFKLPLVMLGRDQERFRRVRSPLLRVSLRLPDDEDAREWFDATYPEYVQSESAPFLPHGAFVAMVEGRLGHGPAELPGLLDGLDAAELEALLAKASLFDVREGDRILRPGERADGLLLVASGQMVERGPDGSRALSVGAVYGDIGGRFLRQVDREVVAETDGRLLVLPASHLEHLLSTADGRLERLQARLDALLGGGRVAA